MKSVLGQNKIAVYVGWFLLVCPIVDFVWAAFFFEYAPSLSFLDLLRSVSLFYWVLGLLAVTCGVLTVRKNRWAPASILFLLGFNLVYQWTQLEPAATRGGLDLQTFPILVNAVLFLAILSQEGWQHLRARRAGGATRVAPAEAKTTGLPTGQVTGQSTEQTTGQSTGQTTGRATGQTIHFEGFGPWAEVIQINQNSLVAKALGDRVPDQLESRRVAVKLADNRVVHARLDRKVENQYIFLFEDSA